MKDEKTKLVTVLSAHNDLLFHTAKTILSNFDIPLPSVEFANNLGDGGYSSEIKVFEKDEEAARKYLSELAENKYYMSAKFDKKFQPYVGYIIIALLALMAMGIVLYFMIK